MSCKAYRYDLSQKRSAALAFRWPRKCRYAIQVHTIPIRVLPVSMFWQLCPAKGWGDGDQRSLTGHVVREGFCDFLLTRARFPAVKRTTLTTAHNTTSKLSSNNAST